MPNLVVYVPADVARALEMMGVSEDIQRKACKEVLAGLAAGAQTVGGVGANDGSPSGAKAGGSSVVTARESSRPSPAASLRSFRSDFKGGSK